MCVFMWGLCSGVLGAFRGQVYSFGEVLMGIAMSTCCAACMCVYECVRVCVQNQFCFDRKVNRVVRRTARVYLNVLW